MSRASMDALSLFDRQAETAYYLSYFDSICHNLWEARLRNVISVKSYVQLGTQLSA